MWPDTGRERGKREVQWSTVDRVDRSTGVDGRQQVDSPQRSTAVDSGHSLLLSTFGRQWVVDSGRQWVDRRMVDRGSTVVDSAVDRVDSGRQCGRQGRQGRQPGLWRGNEQVGHMTDGRLVRGRAGRGFMRSLAGCKGGDGRGRGGVIRWITHLRLHAHAHCAHPTTMLQPAGLLLSYFQVTLVTY